MIKRAFLLVGLLSGMAFGFTPQSYVQLSPPAQQLGGIWVSSGTFVGPVSISSNVVMPGATFYQNAPPAIHGSATNDNAVAGNIGEYISSTTVAASNCSSTSVFFDIGSVPLTPGDWDITILLSAQLNGATATGFYIGIGTGAGSNQSGLVEGINEVQTLPPTASADNYSTIPSWRVSINTNTTYYFKVECSFSAGTPQITSSRISARRIR